MDGTFENFSPPSSTETAVSLEELYSFFECSVRRDDLSASNLNSSPHDLTVSTKRPTLNESCSDEVKKELIESPVQIKLEMMDDNEEAMIEKIVSLQSEI